MPAAAQSSSGWMAPHAPCMPPAWNYVPILWKKLATNAAACGDLAHSSLHGRQARSAWSMLCAGTSIRGGPRVQLGQSGIHEQNADSQKTTPLIRYRLKDRRRADADILLGAAQRKLTLGSRRAVRPARAQGRGIRTRDAGLRD